MKNKKLFAILTLVCFMLTLMPVAAFADVAPGAGEISLSQSMAFTKDAGAVVKTGEPAEVQLKIVDRYSDKTTASALYVWATSGSSNVPVESLNVAGGNVESTAGASKVYVYTLAKEYTTGDSFNVSFTTTGTFKLHVSSVKPEIESGKIANAQEFYMPEAKSTVEVYSDAANAKEFIVKAESTGLNKTLYLEDGDEDGNLLIDANNVTETTVNLTLYANEANKNKDNGRGGISFNIETAGAIDVDKTSVTTDALGQASFKVSGNRAGEYKIYLTSGKYSSTILVKVGAIGANTIKADCETAPYDLIDDDNFADVITFTMYDVNGNKLEASNTAGSLKARVNTAAGQKAYNDSGKTVDVTGYVAVTEQPSASKLKNEDLYLEVVDDEITIGVANGKKITAEGDYTFKAVLDNGSYAIAKCTVKAFDKPVQVVINAPENIELGATVDVDTDWIDANGVIEKDTKGVKLVATGYAVKTFATGTDEATLQAKSDEKYVGSVITITAVDERYNLVASKEVTIANEAKELKFASKTAAVNVNNYIDVNVVDEDGKVVSLGKADAANAQATISYVILDKPEGANVFASTYEDKDLMSDGVFTMNLTSSKVGNVAIQAVVKYEYVAQNDDSTNTNVVKYYTGSQIFAVGNGSVGDVVVMSIGSNEIVINDKKATIDAAPIVQNDRTYVPFRALAEAFGAEVAYDEATQAVTAELNGVTVVMTIGSATYTVNGAEKTMDVAPFINGSRTMVPVRFVAEAFGIKVIPTYDENGATADILFNL